MFNPFYNQENAAGLANPLYNKFRELTEPRVEETVVGTDYHLGSSTFKVWIHRAKGAPKVN